MIYKVKNSKGYYDVYEGSRHIQLPEFKKRGLNIDQISEKNSASQSNPTTPPAQSTPPAQPQQITYQPASQQNQDYYKTLHPNSDYYDIYNKGGQHIDLSTFKKLGLNEKQIPLVQSSQSVRNKNNKDTADKNKETSDTQSEVNKLTLQKQLQDLRTGLGLNPETGAKEPVAPKFQNAYETLKSTYGISGTETQLNNIDKQISDTEASLRQGLYNQEGKLAPMDIIQGRQRELKRQGQEQLDTLNRTKQALTNELNTKLNAVNTIMKLKQMDYQAARETYDNDFKRNMSLIDFIENKQTKDASIENAQKDNARANLTTLMSHINGTKWDSLDTTTQTGINKLEMEAGMPVGTMKAFMSQHPQTKVDYTVTGKDKNNNKTVSFFSYNNGDPKILKTVVVGHAKPTQGLSAEEKSYFKDVASGMSALERGRPWGEVWNYIVTKYHIPPEYYPDLDNLLNKDFWAKPGAFKRWHEAGKSSSANTEFLERVYKEINK